MATNPRGNREALLLQMHQQKMYEDRMNAYKAQTDTTGLEASTGIGNIGVSGGLLGYLMKLLMGDKRTPWMKGLQSSPQAQVPGQIPGGIGITPRPGVDEEMYPWYMPPGEERDVY
jgi:hypothetical protein